MFGHSQGWISFPRWLHIFTGYITVVLAGERFVLIIYPFKVVTICSRNNVMRLMLVLALLAAVATFQRAIEFENVYDGKNNGIITQGCGNFTRKREPGPCSSNKVCITKASHHPFLWLWYPLLDATLKFAAPYAFLMIFNAGIIYSRQNNIES